jgi:DNA-binding beta-propeller fold protein YncE
VSTILGAGEYRYRVLEAWAKLPDNWELGDVAAVGVDRQDRVYVFNRGEHPMMVFDRAGNFLKSWGEGMFARPHGIHMAPDETIFCTDDGDHSVRRLSLEGKLLATIGMPGEPACFMSGEPFRRCTHTALSPKGEIYVSDGYGNARIHKYTPDGRRLVSWGEPGADRGQFNLPHNIACDADGWVYVADRENHRVQVFDGNGRFEAQWHDMHRPSGLYMPPGRRQLCYIGEIGPYYEFNRGAPNLGPRVSIYTHEGALVARLGNTPAAGTNLGQFLSPHGLAVDSCGDIYVGEVAVTAWPSLFPDRPLPKPVRSLQKLVRVTGDKDK